MLLRKESTLPRPLSQRGQYFAIHYIHLLGIFSNNRNLKNVSIPAKYFALPVTEEAAEVAPGTGAVLRIVIWEWEGEVEVITL